MMMMMMICFFWRERSATVANGDGFLSSLLSKKVVPATMMKGGLHSGNDDVARMHPSGIRQARVSHKMRLFGRENRK